jgi:hypothetical protein
VLASAVAWKQKRADWLLLQRLLRASDAPGVARPYLRAPCCPWP